MTIESWRKRGISKEDTKLHRQAVKARVVFSGPVRELTDEENEQLVTFLSPEWDLTVPPLSRFSKAKLEAYLKRNRISITIGRPWGNRVIEEDKD